MEWETTMKEIIDKIWLEGKKMGLSDKEMIEKMEEAIQEKTKNIMPNPKMPQPQPIYAAPITESGNTPQKL